MPIREYLIPGMSVREHEVEVPLDWEARDGRTIRIFLREVCDPEKRGEALPLLAFLQGGPGGKGPRPSGGGPGWLPEALKTHRVILLDQRGTGRSTSVQGGTMRAFATGEAAGDFLQLFLADSIVADFEHVRRTLYEGVRWQTLGQSYGGFLTLAYLSRAPEALSACYVTGGLPGLDAAADEIYRRTYPRVAEKNRRYQKRYPQDRDRLARIADRLAAGDVRLPDGDLLTVRRLQTVGIDFGMAPGYENVHWLVDEAFADAREEQLSDHFLAAVAALTSFDGNPLFAVLQESIYNRSAGPSAWAAERVRAEHPDFAETARPLLLTGEMMYPWMFREIRSLQPFQAGAEALAASARDRRFYDPARLAQNEVPVAAAVYFDDMYVDAGLSLDTAARVGNTRTWVTNEFEHDGLRQSPAVLRRLLDDVRAWGGPLA